MYIEQAFEAMSQQQISDIAKQQIFFSPDYQTLAIHTLEIRRGGVWSNRLNPEKITLARRESDFESDLSNGMVAALIILDDVRVGDVVRLSYTIDGINPIIKGMDHDEIFFAWGEPVLDRRLRALYDPGTKIAQRSFNGAPVLKIKEQADAVLVSAQASRIPALRNEGAYPHWYRPYPSVMFAPQRSWQEVARWAKSLYPDSVILPKELEAKMLEWKAIAKPEDRLMAVLQSMQEDIRYFGIELGESSHRPSAPGETWTRRFGDCKDKAYLMAVVLTRLGIPAVPALANTELGRGLRDNLPAATAFNHVIVQVQMGKQTLWLDPTLTQQRGTASAIDIMDYGYVLPIADGVTDLRLVVRTAASKKQISVLEKYQPSADGKTVDLTITSEYLGGSADSMRRQLVSNGNEEVGKNFAEYYRKRFGELDVLKPFVENDDQIGNRLTLVESYRLKQAWDEKSGNAKNLTVYADSMDLDTKLPDTIDRKSPLFLNSPMQYRHEQVLELPEGWTWLGSAQAEEIKSPGFEYARNIAQVGKSVAIKQSIQFKEDYVPIQDLPDYFAKMREVRDGLNRRFMLSMPAAAQDKDRDARLKNIMRDVIKN